MSIEIHIPNQGEPLPPTQKEIALADEIRSFADEKMGNKKENMRMTDDNTLIWISQESGFERIHDSNKIHRVVVPQIGVRISGEKIGESTRIDETYSFMPDKSIHKLSWKTKLFNGVAAKDSDKPYVTSSTLREEELQELLGRLESSKPKVVFARG